MNKDREPPSFSTLIYSKDTVRHVAELVFNRPEQLNAMNAQMYEEMEQVLADVEEDDDIKVLVISGAGKAFSTGQDLTEVGNHYDDGKAEPGAKPRRPSQRRRIVTDYYWMRIFPRLFNCLKITLAKVDGLCLAGGFDIAMCCDLVVASDRASFGHPGQRLIGPAMEPNQLLWFWRLGPALAKDIMLTGRTLSGEEGLRAGFVNRCVAPEALDDMATRMANRIALLPADGIVMGKVGWNVAAQVTGVGFGHQFGPAWHSFSSNLRFESDEFNFLRRKQEVGTRQAFHDRDKFFGEDV